MKVQDPAIYKIRKETILQYARHLFASKGYNETSMDDIARSSSMQKASLYHYFNSKQRILQEMIDYECGRWSTELKTVSAGDDFRECLLQIGTTFLQNLDDPARREFFQIIHFESHKNPVIFKVLKESPTYRRGVILEVFTKHLEKDLTPVKIAMLVTQFMGGLIHYAVLSRLRGENMCLEKFSDHDYVQQLVNVILGGLSCV